VYCNVGYRFSCGKKIGSKKDKVISNLVKTSFLTALCIALSAISQFVALSIFFYLLHDIFKKIMKILRRVYIQEHISSKVRSSLTSVNSMVKTMGSVIGLTLAGFLVEAYSIETAWLISSTIVIGNILLYYKMKKF
jgi:predicted MFS family arabinose efflux permease